MNSAKTVCAWALVRSIFILRNWTLEVVFLVRSFWDKASRESGWNMVSVRTACFQCPGIDYIDLNSFH